MITSASSTRAATFSTYARGAGATVTWAAGIEDAAATIAASAGATLVCTAAVLARFPALTGALAQAGVTPAVAEDLAATAGGLTALARALAGPAGLVLPVAGIAETGTLVFADDALAPRLLAMLPDVCLALLPVEALLPDLDAAGALLARLAAEGRRYLSLVTGPSRTADIERVLTIGVQGPHALHIVLLDAGEPAPA